MSEQVSSKQRDWRAGCECNRVGLCFRCQAAEQIERLELQIYALTNANKSLADRADGQPPKRHTVEPTPALDRLIRAARSLDDAFAEFGPEPDFIHEHATELGAALEAYDESHSGRLRPGERSACLPADDRGIAEARSSEGGNGGTECASVSIQSREPVGSNSATVGRASPEQLRAKDVDPAPSITAEPPSALDAEDDQALGALEEYMQTSGNAGNWSRQVWDLINRLRVAQLPSTAARDVIAERERQKSVEGWTPEHDDEHNDEQLALAAACYALGSPTFWPWENRWWKLKDRRSNLVRAGALILAEIERLDRHAVTKPDAVDDDHVCGVCEGTQRGTCNCKTGETSEGQS